MSLVKAGLLGDAVDHYDGHVGIVITASDFVFDCDIPITRVTEQIRGHIGTDHEGICKITTGSIFVYIEEEPMALHGSQVVCDGEVRAQAQVVYLE